MPANTRQDIIQRLNAETIQIMQKPEVRTKLIAAGLEPIWSTPKRVFRLCARGNSEVAPDRRRFRCDGD